MDLTKCTCVDPVSDRCAPILAVQGHERRHFEDSAGVHCAIVRVLKGMDPQVIYDQLVTPSQEVLDAKAAASAASEELELKVTAQQEKLGLLREKRLRKEELDSAEVQFLLDYLLGV